MCTYIQIHSQMLKHMYMCTVYHLVVVVALANVVSAVAVAASAQPDGKQPPHTGAAQCNQLGPRHHKAAPKALTYTLKY